MTGIKILFESIAQAVQQLTSNKLRSFLALLGIVIGIFCIAGVMSAVDSLENNIRGSFDRLGDDVVYVSKFSWGEDPGQNYWKWMRHPNPDYSDFKTIARKVKSAALSSFHIFVGLKTLKYRSSTVERSVAIGVTYDYGELFSFQYQRGRYFSQLEYQRGANKCILGDKVAKELFGNLDPIGRQVKLMGRKLEVIGLLEPNGQDIISIMNFDECVLLPYTMAKSLLNLRANKSFSNSIISVKAAPGIPIGQLKDKLAGVLRAHRQLKPLQKPNFALNELSLLAGLLDNVFGVMNAVGLIIGIFAIIVGGVSVANIMFVCVKERTNIIGIKKALGAKRHVILLEFLAESAILCLIGGALGLAFVALVLTALSGPVGFDIYLSTQNILVGLFGSVLIGILAGIVPAIQASALDPVVAIRSK